MDGARLSPGALLSPSAFLSTALELYRRQLRGAWTIVALIAIPAQILVWVMVRVSLSHGAYARGGTVHTGSAALPWVAIALLGFLSFVLTVGALSRLFVETYTGRRSTWEESLAYASTRLMPLLVMAVVAGVLLALGYAFFFVPGVFLTVAWSAAGPVLMFENVAPLQALGRSAQLVRGYWVPTFGALAIAVVIWLGVSYLVDIVLAGIQSSSSINVVLSVQAIARAAGAILTYPFVAALSVAIYANLRAAKEGVSPEGLLPVGSKTL
jgi:hypothetical protein